jgi:hypothetical protein
MKSQADKFTSEMFNPARGRPPKEHPRSGVQRTRDWRNRKNGNVEKAISAPSQLFEKSEPISVTSDKKQDCSWCGLERSNCCGICSVGQLGHIK